MQKILAVLVLSGSSLLGTTITFDEPTFPSGPFASTTFNGVTFSAVGGGGALITQSGPNGTLGLRDSNSPIKETRADFIGGTNFVSVDIGDFDNDADTLFLEVFNAASVSLGFTSQLIDSNFSGMKTLSLNVSSIDHAVFGARDPAINGSSVLADNLTFGQAPEPTTFWMIGLITLGFVASGVKRQLRARLL